MALRCKQKDHYWGHLLGRHQPSYRLVQKKAVFRRKYLSQLIFLCLKYQGHGILQLTLQIWCTLCNECTCSCEWPLRDQGSYPALLFWTHCSCHACIRKNESYSEGHISLPDHRWDSQEGGWLAKTPWLLPLHDGHTQSWYESSWLEPLESSRRQLVWEIFRPRRGTSCSCRLLLIVRGSRSGVFRCCFPWRPGRWRGCCRPGMTCCWWRPLFS